MKKILMELARDESGVTAVEYALMAAAAAAVITGAATDFYENFADALGNITLTEDGGSDTGSGGGTGM